MMVLGRITAADPVSLTDSTMSLVSDIVWLLSEEGRWYLRSLSSLLRKISRGERWCGQSKLRHILSQVSS